MPYRLAPGERKEVVDFGWYVHTGGYRWEAKGSKGSFLVPVQQSVRHATPFTHTGLFRKFSGMAEGRLNQASILRFANQYGPLGVEPSWHLGDLESFETWKNEILDLGEAVSLWQMIVKGDTKGLDHRLRLREDGNIEYRRQYSSTPGKAEVITSRDIDRQRLIQEDTTHAAQLCIQRAVNTHVKGRLIIKLLFDEKHRQLGMHITPDNLAGALWLQFMYAVAGQKKHEKCKTCQEWFEVSPRAKRSSAIFCSVACRLRNYRKRIAKAQRQHARGVPLKKIAEQLETTVSVIKGWVKEGKP